MAREEQDVNERLDRMEMRLKNVEDNQLQYTKTIADVDEKVVSLYDKVDDEFSKVVGTNDHIVSQNNMLLEKVLESRQKADERDDAMEKERLAREADMLKLQAETDAELKKAKSARTTQVWVILLSSSSLITAVVTALLRLS